MYWKVSNKIKKKEQNFRAWRQGFQINPIQQRQRKKKCNEQSLQEVWDYVKWPNLRIIGVCEEEEKSKVWKTYLGEKSKKNFPGLARDLDIQIQEAQRTPGKFFTKRSLPRHIVKDEGKNLKSCETEAPGNL